MIEIIRLFFIRLLLVVSYNWRIDSNIFLCRNTVALILMVKTLEIQQIMKLRK